AARVAGWRWLPALLPRCACRASRRGGHWHAGRDPDRRAADLPTRRRAARVAANRLDRAVAGQRPARGRVDPAEVIPLWGRLRGHALQRDPRGGRARDDHPDVRAIQVADPRRRGRGRGDRGGGLPLPPGPDHRIAGTCGIRRYRPTGQALLTAGTMPGTPPWSSIDRPAATSSTLLGLGVGRVLPRGCSAGWRGRTGACSPRHERCSVPCRRGPGSESGAEVRTGHGGEYLLLVVHP